MKCIFCKKNSSDSKSVEHIIPESLGNKSHLLPRGTVCDKCNNYFAIKIENQVLNNSYFKSLRHRNAILNKKDNLPTENGFIAHPEGGKVEIASVKDNVLEVIIPSPRIFDLVKEGKVRNLYIPIVPLPEEKDLLFSRFIGKIAFEALADKISTVEGWNEELVDNIQFDGFRDYIRYGKGPFWPYTQRRVYDEEEAFVDYKDTSKPQPYQVLHEYDFLFVDGVHLYFICIIMGVEYAMNIADRTIEHYLHWLEVNNQKSPLEREYQKRHGRI